ncbi:MAG: aspartate carbamoyltransferase regulatory subunit [Bacteroidetes bacterium]|nr:MAG: aspartate carbamoyltransferase regulatory subunit [Bacteroidota bacterium]
MDKKRELSVSALENGTVIDHIPQGHVLQVMSILNLEDFDDQIYFGANLDSKKYGKKGLIKVSNRFFKSNEINKISLVAPTATLIEIRDFEVVNKTGVTIPDEVHEIAKCINPKCITNNEYVPTHFTVIDKEDLKLKCHYCEKITKKENVQFI